MLGLLNDGSGLILRKWLSGTSTTVPFTGVGMGLRLQMLVLHSRFALPIGQSGQS